MADDPQKRFEDDLQLDRSLTTPGREGLAGTTSGDLYGARTSEDITRPPDGSPPSAQPQWRKDFPVDWPNDQYVARRDFAKFLVLTSGSFAVGQGWIAAQEVLRRNRAEEPVRKRVASLRDVAVGASLQFTYPGEHDRCLLVRTGEREFVAYSQECTHLSCAVVPDVDKGLLRCPCHEGFFDLATGRNVAGPPPRPLPRVALQIENGEIWATHLDERTV